MIKNVSKVMAGMLCSILLMGANTCMVKANAEVCVQNQEDCENGAALQTFYSNREAVYVNDGMCVDVTDQFWDETEYMYLENNWEGIKDYIVTNNLVLHLVLEDNAKVGTFALSQYKSVASEMIYFILWDTNRATNIEVTAELKGGIWYDVATDEVKRVSDATYNILTMQVGSPGISLYANDFQTGSSVVNGKGYFWGNCHFYGEDPDNMYGYAYDYGTKLVSFYATP